MTRKNNKKPLAISTTNWLLLLVKLKTDWHSSLATKT